MFDQVEARVRVKLDMEEDRHMDYNRFRVRLTLGGGQGSSTITTGLDYMGHWTGLEGRFICWFLSTLTTGLDAGLGWRA